MSKEAAGATNTRKKNPSDATTDELMHDAVIRAESMRYAHSIHRYDDADLDARGLLKIVQELVSRCAAEAP